MGEFRPEIIAAFCRIPTTAPVFITAALKPVFSLVGGAAESGRAAMFIAAAGTAAGRISLVNTAVGRKRRYRGHRRSLGRIAFAHRIPLL